MSVLLKTYQIIASLDTNARIKLIKIQIIIFLSSIAETASLLLVAPIIATLAGNYSTIENVIIYIDHIFNININTKDALSILSITYIVLTIISSLIGIVSIKILSNYASFITKETSVNLLKRQLTSDYLVFCKKPQSYYINFDLNEVSRFADNILQPIAQINSRIISGIFISSLLLLMNPLVAVLASFVFSTSYYLMYVIVRRRLKDNGEVISRESSIRTSFVKDSLRSIKEVLIYKTDNFFVSRYESSTSAFYAAYANLNVLYNVPRHLIELLIYVAFGIFIYLISAEFISLNVEHLSYLVIFGLAAVKLLPIFQQTYSSIARIKGSTDVVDRVHKEIFLSGAYQSDSTVHSKIKQGFNSIESNFHSIKLNNIFYSFQNTNINVIEHLSYTFSRTGRVAIVGPSGSGKSTLVDIVVGLLNPTAGSIDIRFSDSGGNLNDSPDLLDIGYVPQDPILVQGSILDNITMQFSEDSSLISQAMQALDEVGLHDFVSNLPNGILSTLSSDNFGISGGQRQRIAIARALYRRSPVIVLDEPTSALDSESERTIIELLRRLSEKILVITIAHRLNTIIDYDDLLFLKNGKLVASGTYSYLINNVSAFQDFVTFGGNNPQKN